MPLIRYNVEAPVRAALVETTRMVSMRWLQWFQAAGDRLSAVSRLDAAYDPGSISAGAVSTVNVTFSGVKPGDLVTAVSFSPMATSGTPTAGIRMLADVTSANTVSVSFLNVSGGAIDLDAGTIRIQVERVA
jgi:hypothetical protein